jgi:hypothetical protein
MFKQFLDNVPGADSWMIASLLTFFLFFVLVGVYLFIVDRPYVRRMSRLPLDESESATHLNS